VSFIAPDDANIILPIASLSIGSVPIKSTDVPNRETEMSTVTLHYIHDPLCGWCYAAAPLVKAAREVLPVRWHAGGMMAGPRRQPVSEGLRSYVLPHDRRIAQLTGQPFGEAYADGLLRDTTAVLDSEPPIAAMLAAEALAGRGLDLLARLQQAHYLEGRRIADRPVLEEMAASIGLDRAEFTEALGDEGETVQSHIAQTRALMQRLGVAGFPSFALERDGRWSPVEAGEFLGRPAEFSDWLRQQVPQAAAASSKTGADFACGVDGCAI
jgi:putative protein-disulfide isomerase